ncbi:hypothetical protein TNCV_1725751 [Trichonephila clavipes]|nr:hypothetical protein TNCV_1725751 [Trichonephila clavipes]
MNGCTASSRQLTAGWSTAISVLMSASSIPRHLLHRGWRARIQQQGQEQAKGQLSTCVVQHIMPSSDHLQISMLCADLA